MIKLVEIKRRTKEAYGMNAEDWWVVGLDEDGEWHQGWESDFEIEEENDDA